MSKISKISDHTGKNTVIRYTTEDGKHSVDKEYNGSNLINSVGDTIAIHDHSNGETTSYEPTSWGNKGKKK